MISSLKQNALKAFDTQHPMKQIRKQLLSILKVPILFE